MQLKLLPAYIITFLLLLIVMLELHEVVHISIGRIICGCWGVRDFNVWSLGENCQESKPAWWLATLAGPFFSFGMMWLGMYWLSSGSAKLKAWGFAFIFANFPFGRITTVMFGGGDEMVVVRNFMNADYTRTEMILVGTIIVLLAGVPPVFYAWKALSNKRAWIYIAGFLTLPLLFLLVYVLIALNTLLTNGFLSQNFIMGTPLLITLHTIIAATGLLIMRRHLEAFSIGLPKSASTDFYIDQIVTKKSTIR